MKKILVGIFLSIATIFIFHDYVLKQEVHVKKEVVHQIHEHSIFHPLAICDESLPNISILIKTPIVFYTTLWSQFHTKPTTPPPKA